MTSNWVQPSALERLHHTGASRFVPQTARRTAVRGDVLDWALGSWTAAQRAADPSIDQLADAAMHGVRNSLSAILLGTELLGRHSSAESSPHASGVLEHIANAATRVHEQVEELADLGRLAAGRPICATIRLLPLHSIVAHALSNALAGHHNDAIEHDRLGRGDCYGDAARITQFVHLALNEVRSLQTDPSHRIVISEVSETRFRIAVHGTSPAPDAPQPESASRKSASRRARMQGIARVHRGYVKFFAAPAGVAPFVEGWFDGSKPK